MVFSQISGYLLSVGIRIVQGVMGKYRWQGIVLGDFDLVELDWELEIQYFGKFLLSNFNQLV